VKRPTLALGAASTLVASLACWGMAPCAEAGWDVTVYGGLALPTYEQRLEFRLPSVPTAPNLHVTPRGNFELTGKGGSVFGGAAALELGGVFALEGRLDTATLKLDTGGIAYDVDARFPAPIGNQHGALLLGSGSFQLDRIKIYSANVRLRTPGTVSLFFSGGLSYLGDLSTASTIPVSLELAGIPIDAGLGARVSLVATPTQENHRWGANAGVGLRARLSDHLAVMGEARAFGFREYELRLHLATAPTVAILDDIIQGFDTVKFPPVYFHGAVGLVLTF